MFVYEIVLMGEQNCYIGLDSEGEIDLVNGANKKVLNWLAAQHSLVGVTDGIFQQADEA
jgi:hypothetical protein